MNQATRRLRPLSCELSCLENADGSATFRSGSTQVLASVHGPIAPRLPHHEAFDGAQVSVAIKSCGTAAASAAATTTMHESEWSDLIRRVLEASIVLERYPRSVIQVVLTVLSSDGSVLGTCVHAAVSAVMDAGIELRFMPTAVACCCRHRRRQQQRLAPDDDRDRDSAAIVLLDPTSEQEQHPSNAGVVVLVVDDASKILASHTTAIATAKKKRSSSSAAVVTTSSAFGDSGGGIPLDTFLRCCEVAVSVRPAITAFWRTVVEQKVKRESQTLWS